MTRKRWQKLVRAFLTQKHIEGKTWYKEPIGKSYKRIRNTKIDWKKELNNYDDSELANMMMYNCSLYLRDYACNYNPSHIL